MATTETYRSDWAMRKLKYLAAVSFSSVDRKDPVNDSELAVDICHYPDAYANECIMGDTPISRGHCTADELRRFGLREGQTIITKDSESPTDIGIPAYVVEDRANAVCGYHLAIIEPSENAIHPKFLFRYLQSASVMAYYAMNSNGVTRFGLGKPTIESLPVPLPDLDEQRKIAAYLDHTTALIDQLIAKNEQLITLLDDQRKAIINEAVTKGLDPTVPMKDSGIGWLGEVPKHWHAVKIKHLFDFQSGATPSTKIAAYWNGTIPWVSSKDMKTKYLERTEDYITEEGLANSSCSLIEPGAVIMVSRSGILQRTLPVAINKVPLVVNQDQKVLRPKGECSAEFFYHYVKGNEPNLLREWIKSGTTVESIEIDTFMDHKIHLPPPKEQDAIVAHLLEKTKGIEEAQQRAAEVKGLLAEYRQSIISEAVTGKIDLREWEPAQQQAIRS